jgi:hypothetical protein
MTKIKDHQRFLSIVSLIQPCQKNPKYLARQSLSGPHPCVNTNCLYVLRR